MSKSKKKSVESFESLTFDPNTPWYTTAAQWNEAAVLSDASGDRALMMTPGQAAALRTQGKAELERQAALYRRQHSKEHAFHASLLTEGTLKDRLNALTLTVSSGPVYHLAELQTMLKAAEPGAQRAEAVLMALELILELFMNSYLPDNRKLKFLEQRPSLPTCSDATRTLTAFVWTVEDLIKRAYLQFIDCLETVLTSSVSYPYLKNRACNMVATCLATKPESESILLQLLVNRLADKSLAGKILYLLSSVWNSHPNMTPVIIEYVWKAIQGSLSSKTEHAKSSENTKYYGLLVLAQMPLDKKRAEWADRLISIYLTLFQSLLVDSEAAEKKMSADRKHKKRPVNKRRERKVPAEKADEKPVAETQSPSEHSKLFSLVLKAIHRALPFASKSTDAFESELERLYRLAHSKIHGASFQLNIETLWLLFKLHGQSSRYKRALYESLLDERLGPHLAMKSQIHYCQLIKQVLAAEDNEERLVAFLKRLFQICAMISTSFICASLGLLQRALSQRPGLAAVLLKKSALKDDQIVSKYDPKKRDPEYSAALSEPLYELVPFLYHYHPSVKHLCAQVFGLLVSTNKRAAVPQAGSDTVVESMESFSLGAFLDRFVYKNPKKESESSSQVVSSSSSLSDKLKLAPSAKLYYSLPEAVIPAHEKFFHAYFQSKKDREALKAAKDAKRADKKGKRSKSGQGSDSDSDAISFDDVEGQVSDDAAFDSDFSDLLADEEDEEDGLSELEFSDEDDEAGEEDDEMDDNGNAYDKDGDSSADEDESFGSENDDFVDKTPSKKKKRTALPLLADADAYEAYMNDDHDFEPTKQKKWKAKQR